LGVKNALLSKHPDTKALFVIGSVVDGTNNGASDIDFVWVKQKKISFEHKSRLEDKFNARDSAPRIQLITLTPRLLKWYFENAATLAHSVQNGITVWKDGSAAVNGFLEKELGLPGKKWMREWFTRFLGICQFETSLMRRQRFYHRKFCKKRCICWPSDGIARVVVNFSILYLETKGIVPLSRVQIVRGFVNGVSFKNQPVLKGVRLAVKYSGKEKALTLSQAEAMFLSARWLKARLSRALGVTKARKDKW
jgi:hypothetical protein